MMTLGDRNLIVSYLQSYLTEYYPKSLVSASEYPYSSAVSNEYSVANSPIRMTGVYDIPTYSSLSLMMASFYPNEGYPQRWDLSDGQWTVTDFDCNRFVNSVSKLITEADGSIYLNIDESTYNDILGDDNTEDNAIDISKYLTYDEIQLYITAQSSLTSLVNSYISKKLTFTTQSAQSGVVAFLTNNLSYISQNNQIAEVPDRVISYILGEVVTPNSLSDEIMRVQQLLYPGGLSPMYVGRYFEYTTSSGDTISMMNDIKEIQSNYIDSYKNGLPTSYQGFKVTGYVDPWTEVIIKQLKGTGES